MKVAPVVLGLSGVTILVVAIGLGIWAGMPANPLATLAILVLQAGALAKLFYLLLTGLGIWIAVLGVSVLTKGRSGDPSLPGILALLSMGLGLLATLLAGISIGRAMQQTNTSDLMVIAPSLAEALTPLAIGLLLGAFATACQARAAPAAV